MQCRVCGGVGSVCVGTGFLLGADKLAPDSSKTPHPNSKLLTDSAVNRFTSDSPVLTK